MLAADSRITLTAQPVPPQTGSPLVVAFDNATKLLTLNKPHNFVAAVTYGAALIGLRTAHSFLPEFEVWLGDEGRLKVEEYANKLSEFFMQRWKEAVPEDHTGSSMVFIVGGYNEGEAYGKVFLFRIPDGPKPEPRNAGEKDFGMTWGGQLQVASRLVHGFDPSLPGIIQNALKLSNDQVQVVSDALRRLAFTIPYDILPLQDCIDLATFLIRTTMTAQNLSVGIRGVGGTIEVAIITRTKGLEFIQQKSLRGEATSP